MMKETTRNPESSEDSPKQRNPANPKAMEISDWTQKALLAVHVSVAFIVRDNAVPAESADSNKYAKTCDNGDRETENPHKGGEGVIELNCKSKFYVPEGVEVVPARRIGTSRVYEHENRSSSGEAKGAESEDEDQDVESPELLYEHGGVEVRGVRLDSRARRRSLAVPERLFTGSHLHRGVSK
ncbi:hypothetical protein U1Q18_026132 [Sarracenia purpurea var. burkii]